MRFSGFERSLQGFIHEFGVRAQALEETDKRQDLLAAFTLGFAVQLVNFVVQHDFLAVFDIGGGDQVCDGLLVLWGGIRGDVIGKSRRCTNEIKKSHECET